MLDFSFKSIQLNRLNWRDYVRNPNPVASALMAKMRTAVEDRPKVKLECLRMLATLKLDRARSTMISVFMDSYLKLTGAETVVYNREIEAIDPQEREVVMQWTNEWIERDKTEGRQQGRRELVLLQLRRRFGSILEDVQKRIDQLSDRQLDDLAGDLFELQSASDVERWFSLRA